MSTQGWIESRKLYHGKNIPDRTRYVHSLLHTDRKSVVDAPKLHEQLIQAMDYLRQTDTGECKVLIIHLQSFSVIRLFSGLYNLSTRRFIKFNDL